ncbi:D-lactate dehydrogenase [Escherichia coli]|uniref:D-lactate dehydrogenase n=1 Tax=Escherichia coli TaxID=562 RepID=A0A376S998_ECOLX|nr:D-lactate dehydrogenase [Escherichia coli]
MNLPDWSVIHTCSPIPQKRPAIARASVLVRGDALAVVFPGSLLELWRVLKACVTADKIILMQAANTGLTEGSTPNGNDYDRDIVIISTLRLDKLHVLGKGEQVLAYPGTTLYSLGKSPQTAGTRTALGDWIIVYRRIGHRRYL